MDSVKVLVVDDDRVSREVLCSMVRRGGYQASSATGGLEALRMLKTEECSLVLLDLCMEDMHGLEVLQRIRQDRTAGELPVMIVSATKDDPQIVEALDRGANDFLTKPVGAQLLLAKIRRHLTLRSEPSTEGGSQFARDVVLEPGTRFAHYEIVSLLGEGSLGRVYRARDQRLTREVALKIARKGQHSAALNPFDVEARAVARASHPHVVMVYDTGAAPMPYLAMELVEGGHLLDPSIQLPLEVEHACLWCIEILEALRVMHAQSVVHANLKPQNIFITAAGHVKIMDFAMAKILTEADDLTALGKTAGKSQYMAPEQVVDEVFGQLTPLSDLFSVAGILYLLLTGGAPFPTATATQHYFSIVTKEPRSIREQNPEVSAELEAICLRGLRKQPEQRYQSAEEFAAALYSQI